MKHLAALIMIMFLFFQCTEKSVDRDACTDDPTSCGCPEAVDDCEVGEDPDTLKITGKVYVSPNGNDSNDGSEGKPFKSIQKAASAAGEGGLEIILRGGTYVSNEIRIRNSNVKIHSYPGEWAVIRAATNVEDVASCLWFSEPGTGNFALEDLEIVGGYYYGIKFESNWDDDRSVPFDKRQGISNVTIRNCKIHDTGRDCIKITPGCKDIRVLNCEIYRSGVGPANVEAQNAEGIDNVNADNMVVSGCYFHDIATNGMYAKGGARNCVMENNLIVNCGEFGMAAGFLDTDAEWFNRTTNPDYQESFDIIIRNNIVVNAKWGGVGLFAAVGSKVYNNTFVHVGSETMAALHISAGETYTGSGAPLAPPCRDLEIMNNIFVQPKTADRPMVYLRSMNDDTAPPLTGASKIDYNIYYKTAGVSFYQNREKDGLSLAAWKSSTGFDVHSREVDPMLDNGYHLLAGSPAIKAGISSSVVTIDYDGDQRNSTPDIGADAFGGKTLSVPPSAGVTGTGWKR